MALFKSSVLADIGYEPFPTENYIYCPLHGQPLKNLPQDEDVSINTEGRGWVETTNQSKYESLSTEKRRELIQRRINNDAE